MQTNEIRKRENSQGLHNMRLFFAPGCATKGDCGTHLFPESPACRPDPVLIVIVSRGARQDEAHAGLVLGSHVAEELGGL